MLSKLMSRTGVLRSTVCSLLLMMLSACGDSAPSTDQGAPPPEGVAGRFYDVSIPSEVDGAAIAFTVFEPRQIAPGRDYPLVLHGHGFGGSRFTEPDAFINRLNDAGFAVISIDLRGFGESGGQVQAMDPAFEGRDLPQVVDWAEANLPWLRYRPDVRGVTNLVLGAYGGSYGGAYQLLLNATDPKARLDAIVPDITWTQLLYSFYPNRVFKTVWLSLLEAAGTAGSGGRLAPFINEAYVEGTLTNNVSESRFGPFIEFGNQHFCETGQARRVDALLTQGMRDGLFTFNEAYANYQCLSALGGDVRLFTHQSGHLVPGLQAAGPFACGALAQQDATLAWFQEKLNDQPGATAGIAEICLSLGADDSIEVDRVQVGAVNGAMQEIPANTLLVGPAAQLQGAIVVDLGVATADGVLAGIPEISLTISDPAGLDLGDPRVFVGVGVQRGGAGAWVLVDEQVQPFRGYGTDDDQLNGIATRLQTGDHYGLLIYGYSDFYFNNGSRDSLVVNVSGRVGLPILTGN